MLPWGGSGIATVFPANSITPADYPAGVAARAEAGGGGGDNAASYTQASHRGRW